MELTSNKLIEDGSARRCKMLRFKPLDLWWSIMIPDPHIQLLMVQVFFVIAACCSPVDMTSHLWGSQPDSILQRGFLVARPKILQIQKIRKLQKKNNNWKFLVFTNLTQFTSGLRNCDMFAVTSWEVQVRKRKLTASRLDPFNFWFFWRGVFRLLTLGISNGGVLKMGDPQTNHMFQYENGQILNVNSTAYHSPATLHPRNLRITSPQHLLPKDTPAPLQGSYCTVIMPHACDPVRCQYREWMLRKSVPSVSSNEFNQEESWMFTTCTFGVLIHKHSSLMSRPQSWDPRFIFKYNSWFVKPHMTHSESINISSHGCPRNKHCQILRVSICNFKGHTPILLVVSSFDPLSDWWTGGKYLHMVWSSTLRVNHPF